MGEARALGVRVWDAGWPEWSRRIDESVASGATSSEILMGVRWTLGQMVAEEPEIPRELSRDAEKLAKRIGKALR